MHAAGTFDGYRCNTNTILSLKHDAQFVQNESIVRQMLEARKNKRVNALKEVKRFCKEFGFTAGMLKSWLAEGRKNKWNPRNSTLLPRLA